MYSIQRLNFFGPATKQTCRGYSTKQADRIKLLNYTSRVLFGPVIKRKPVKKQSKIKSNINAENRHEQNHSSEMFWVLGNKWNKLIEPNIVKAVKPIVKRNVRQSTERKSLSNELRQSQNKTEIVYQNAKSMICNTTIPFSDEQLKQFLLHPLVSDEQVDPHNSLTNEMQNFPSVGKILQSTMPYASRKALMKWKEEKLLELGEQGFEDLQKSNLNSGYAFHWSLQNYFHSNEIPLASSSVYKVWESVQSVLDNISTPPELVEKSLYHPTLKYKGICDCVSNVQNELTVIEWKKSGRKKQTLGLTYDAPIQLCAYLGALNLIPEYKGRIQQGMVVVAYENGKPADVYKLNQVMLRTYWRFWLGRLQEFWIRTRDGTLLEPI